MNMGAYAHVSPRLQTAMLSEGRHLHDHIPYAGRGPSASTATGFGSVHAQEQVWTRSDCLCQSSAELQHVHFPSHAHSYEPPELNTTLTPCASRLCRRSW